MLLVEVRGYAVWVRIFVRIFQCWQWHSAEQIIKGRRLCIQSLPLAVFYMLRLRHRLTSFRENVCSNSQNVKVIFLDFEKT